MASVSDNALFLYHCIVQSQPKLDWNLIGAGLHLKPGTASMRWQRLKPRLENLTAGTLPASATIDDATLFLYQMIIHTSCKIDFNAVGKVTGLKTGTASMRFRRLKEKIRQHPSVPQANERTQTKATPKKSQTPKSSTSVKRKVKEPDSDLEDDDHEEDHSAKKLKLKDETTPSKRQTRGKVQDYMQLLGDSSSSGATSMASANISSAFEATASTPSIDYDSETTGDQLEDASCAEVRKVITTKGRGRNAKKTSVLVQSKLAPRQSEKKRSATATTKRSEECAVASDQDPVEESTMALKAELNTHRGSESSMVEEYDDVEEGLSSLDPGMMLLPKRMVTPDSSDIKSEAAEINGPTSLLGSSSSHTSECLQVAADRAASLSPEDSISSIGLVVKRKSEQVEPAPKTDSGCFGRLMNFFKSP